MELQWFPSVDGIADPGTVWSGSHKGPRAKVKGPKTCRPLPIVAQQRGAADGNEAFGVFQSHTHDCPTRESPGSQPSYLSRGAQLPLNLSYEDLMIDNSRPSCDKDCSLRPTARAEVMETAYHSGARSTPSARRRSSCARPYLEAHLS